MFLFAQTLHGVAGVLLYTLAPAYIDGSVSDKQSPIYMGKYGQITSLSIEACSATALRITSHDKSLYIYLGIFFKILLQVITDEINTS